jgi:glutamyl-tRNA synthetase
LKKAIKPDTAELLEKTTEILESIKDYTAENTQSGIKNWITEAGIGFGKVMQPLRLAMVGALQGPDLFHIMAMVGKEESIKRLRKLKDKI